MVEAGVFGRGEYLKEKTPSNLTASNSESVSAKSAAVSPGNPTITSVVIVVRRFALRIMAIFSRYSSREYVLCMRRRTREEPDCTGSCTWLQILEFASITEIMSGVKSCGCEVVKRTRRIPGTCAACKSNSLKRILRDEGSA